MPRRKIKPTRLAREKPYAPALPRQRQSNPGDRIPELASGSGVQNVARTSSGMPNDAGEISQPGHKALTDLSSPQLDRMQSPQPRIRRFRRRGIFPFLALPLEIRQIIYHLLLIPIGEKLVTLHFGQFIPGLGGPGSSQNILRVCRSVRREALALLYSGTVYIRGFDLMDFSSSARLSQHPWLCSEIRPIKNLQVRFSLLARETEFKGRSEVFLKTLPECRIVRIEMLDEQDWRNAEGQSFIDFVSSLRLEGLEVELKGSERSEFNDSREKVISLFKSP